MFHNYEVVINRCDCHPETCCCKPYKLMKNGEKHSTYFNKETALEVCNALIEKEIRKVKDMYDVH